MHISPASLNMNISLNMNSHHAYIPLKCSSGQQTPEAEAIEDILQRN